ncbi:hypothetical protein JHK82_040059 [Glycine max]|nr:hypothetical protein JHK82_040059 [Glycine max]KAG5122131.1 hypothetical protein JHK84_040471 [Glycine max]
MGIILLCFKPGEDVDSLGLTGQEGYTIDLPSNVNEIRPGQDVTMVTDTEKSFVSTLRFDTEAIFYLSSLLVLVHQRPCLPELQLEKPSASTATLEKPSTAVKSVPLPA